MKKGTPNDIKQGVAIKLSKFEATFGITECLISPEERVKITPRNILMDAIYERV